MKVAVMRYSLSLQTQLDSTVGGGKFTSRCIEVLRDAGHEVVVTCKAGRATVEWLGRQGIQYEPKCKSLRSFGGVLVLTGPRNALYGESLFSTYRLLATLPRGAPAAYAQWDRALPFAFRPEHESALAREGFAWEAIGHLRWHLLSQLRRVRSVGGRSVAYGSTPFVDERCVFELEEWAAPDKQPYSRVGAGVEAAVAYFGSDRPGRLAEFKRWFCAPGSPRVHVYGRWSDAARAACSSANVEFRGAVREDEVRGALNRYAATLYMADPAYVKSDFIAQRFFENAMAGVPTLYSDYLQPTVRGVVEASGLMLSRPEELAAWVELLARSDQDRAALTAMNEAVVDGVARALDVWRLSSALGRVFE